METGQNLVPASVLTSKKLGQSNMGRGNWVLYSSTSSLYF